MLYIYFHTLTTLCDSSGSRRAFGGFEGALVGGIVLFVLILMIVLVVEGDCVGCGGCVGCGCYKGCACCFD